MASGEIHALLGENGAGKSTLVGTLAGLVRPDAGALSLAGVAVDLAEYGPGEAVARGVGVVHQHCALVPGMTVAENFCFGLDEGALGPSTGRARWIFRPARASARIAELAARFDLAVAADRRVDALSVGERQRAEILRVLARGARLLVLDEPTAVLTPAETDGLFDSLRQLRAEGRTVIFISHKLAEVEALADRVTILRRGRVEAVRSTGEVDARALGRLMLGRDLPALARGAPGRVAESRPRLALRGLSAPGLSEAGRLRGIDLEVGAGEILGIVGVDGNGQRELEEVLAGVRRPSAGELRIDGEPVELGVRTLRRAGVAHLSGDRESAALIAAFTLTENTILKGSYDDRRFFRRGWVDLPAARRATRDAIERYSITPEDPDALVETLSGGNAQKLAVARELSGAPVALVAFNPTRGLDVGSARFVHERLLEHRARGAALLLISTDLDEVLGTADRVQVLVRGAVVPVPRGSDRAAVGALMLGAEAG